MSLLESIAKLRVLVIGDVILDRYIDGHSTRSCPEGDAPVIDQAGWTRCYPGGAGNVAANAAALGAWQVSLISVVGRDNAGDQIADIIFEALSGNSRIVRSEERKTLVKTRISVDGRLVARVDRGTTSPLDPDREVRVIYRIEEEWAKSDVVIVSDYGKGVMTPAVIKAIERLQRDSHKTLVIDAKDLAKYRDCRPKAVTPNFKEAMKLYQHECLGYGFTRSSYIRSLQESILDRTGSEIVAVTMDSDGALAFDRTLMPERTVPAPDVVENTSGAGDTFTAAFALALASGFTLPRATHLAQRASDVVVAKPHTATCSALELGLTPGPTSGLVLATGCFDVLHAGHVALLESARKLGERLVVGINSDESIAGLKGSGRPINGEGDRKAMLMALRCVDEVVVFEQHRPDGLIVELKPAVFVKGGDYCRESLPEAGLVERLGGRVVIIPRVDPISSTSIIDKQARCHDAPSSIR